MYAILGHPVYDQQGWSWAVLQLNPDRLVKVDVLLIEHEAIRPDRQIKKSSIYVHVTQGEADRPYAVEVVGWPEREPVVVSLGIPSSRFTLWLLLAIDPTLSAHAGVDCRCEIARPLRKLGVKSDHFDLVR